MTNRFDVLLYADDVRWAAAEGVSETVVAAGLLLFERSIGEIVSKLSTVELEQVIKLVGRSPRVYPPGTLDELKQRRALVLPEPPQRSSKSLCRDVAVEKQHAGTRGADPRGQPLAARFSARNCRGRRNGFYRRNRSRGSECDKQARQS